MNIGTSLYNQTEIYQILDKEELNIELKQDTKVLFIVPDCENEHYKEEYTNLINNIFGALKLTDTSFLIVPLAKQISLSSLFKYTDIQYFIIFGYAEKLIEFQFEYIRNRPILLQDKNIIFTDNLELLSNPANKIQKNEFWSGLQRMFFTKK